MASSHRKRPSACAAPVALLPQPHATAVYTIGFRVAIPGGLRRDRWHRPPATNVAASRYFERNDGHSNQFSTVFASFRLY